LHEENGSRTEKLMEKEENWLETRRKCVRKEKRLEKERRKW